MKAVAEPLLLDEWKSFKTFYPMGRMKLHSKNEYAQFSFLPGGQLSIRLYKEGTAETLAKGESWTLTVRHNSHYLSVLGKRLTYEIITVNHSVLVLRDVATDEKTFFTRARFWEDFLTTSREAIL